MKTFTDAAGRTWTISLTIDAVKRVRDLLDVNLLEPESGDPPLITRIGTDVIMMVDIIYCLIKPQAELQNITDAEFGQALGGEAVKSACDAFYAEMIDFFRGSGRTDRVKAIEKQTQIIGLAVSRAEAEINQFEIGPVLDRMFGNLSSVSPGPSA